MALVERLLGTEKKIPVHSFMAAMGELQRGEVTRVQVIAAFELDTSATAQLDVLIAHVQAMPAAERFKFRTELHDVLLLAEDGLAYNTPAALVGRLAL